MSAFSVVNEPETLYQPDSGARTTPVHPSPDRQSLPVWRVASIVLKAEHAALDATWNDFQEGSGSVYPLAHLVQSATTSPYATWVRLSIPTTTPDTGASTAQMLNAIKSDLSFNITELAELLDVERPTLYSWLAEKSLPHPINRDRLGTLFMVALAWRKLSKQPLGILRRHFFESGKSLLDLMKLNPLPLSEVKARLMILNEMALERTIKRRPTGQELAKKYGIKTKSDPKEWDLISGKRIGME
jgi:hypothetical protein